MLQTPLQRQLRGLSHTSKAWGGTSSSFSACHYWAPWRAGRSGLTARGQSHPLPCTVVLMKNVPQPQCGGSKEWPRKSAHEQYPPQPQHCGSKEWPRKSAHEQYPPNPNTVVARKGQGRALMCIVSVRCSPSLCQDSGPTQPHAFHLPKHWDPLAKTLPVL